MDKTCTRCLVTKPIASFGPRKGAKDGINSVCRDCARERHKGYLQKYLSNPVNVSKYKESSNRWRLENPEAAKQLGHTAWNRLRQEMLSAYGRECACCGESEEAFLTLEHMNGDGSQHRKEVGGGSNSYRDLKRRGWPQDGFCVLCMNCNWAKRRSGICPHQRKKP